MSFPPPLPPPSFMTPPFDGGNVGGFWPDCLMNNEHPNSHSHFEHAPQFKRPRTFESNPLNSWSRGTSRSIFFKTRMCAKFLEGNCPNGEHCTFAHGVEDLREPPPNWQELVLERDRVGNWNDDQRIIHRMKICKKFYNGEKCPYGEKCNFLHESPSKFKNDTETTRESSAISIGTMGPVVGHEDGSDQPDSNRHVNASLDAFRVNMKPVFRKTKLCTAWEATGYCPFEEKCHFAHGQSELQLLGGLVEAEWMMNIGSISTTLLSVPANDAAPANTAVGAPPTEEGDAKKGSSLWKGTKKINRIYADWIDDLSPPHSLPIEEN